MDPVTLALLIKYAEMMVQAIELGIEFAPTLWSDIKNIISLLTSGTTLTPEQIAQADATLLAAHTQLQEQIAQDAIEDAKV